MQRASSLLSPPLYQHPSFHCITPSFLCKNLEIFIYPVLSMTNQYKSNHMTKTMIGYFQDYAFIELWEPQLQNISLLCTMFKQAGILVLCCLTALAHFWSESGDANSKDGFPNKLPGYGTENGQKTGHIECFEFIVLTTIYFYSSGVAYSNGNADLELALLQQGSAK